VQPFIELGGVVAGNGAQPLAQHCFNRRLPTGFNLYLLPKRHGTIQPMASQPFRQLAAVLRARLHLLQRSAARLPGSQFTLDPLQLFLHLAPCRFHLRQLQLQLLQVILIASQFLTEHAQLFFLLGEIQRNPVHRAHRPHRGAVRGAG
jgi:hypothetical protein